MSDTDEESEATEELPDDAADGAESEDADIAFEEEPAWPEDVGALDQSEIDDLFDIGMDDGPPTTGLEVLLSNTQVQHKRLPLLEACFSTLVRTLTSSLRVFTSENVELSIADSLSVRFGHYIEAVPIPAFISVFNAVEWRGNGLIIIDSPLIYSIIDVLLGGRRSPASLSIEGRSFTPIEATLMERMIDLILKEMSSAFEPLSKIEFRHERLESNPSLASIVYPTDAAILLKIDVEMEGRGGRIEILIPYATLEPVSDVLRQMFMGEKFGQDTIWEGHWAREMLMADTELEVSFGQQAVPLSTIMELDVGSTLQLGSRPHDPVILKCGDVPLLRGKVGRVGDQMAIRVENWVRSHGGQQH